MQRSSPDGLQSLFIQHQMTFHEQTTQPCLSTFPINPFHTSQTLLQTSEHENCWAADLFGCFQGNENPKGNLKYQTVLKPQGNTCETFNSWLKRDNNKLIWNSEVSEMTAALGSSNPADAHAVNSVLREHTGNTRSPHWSPFFLLPSPCLLEPQRSRSRHAAHFRAFSSHRFSPLS